jgi:aminomethyltransferase
MSTDSTALPKRTPLYDAHVAAGGQMVPFAGWEMPVQYANRGLVAEHEATRNTCGLFDVSHMGEILVEGPGAVDEVNHLVTNDASKLIDGGAMYALLLQPDGNAVDDLYVYRLAPELFLLVVNASNVDKDFAHMQAMALKPERLRNRSDDFAQIALQGPKASEILAKVAPGEAIGLPRNFIRVHSFRGADVLAATTGYTGEAGFELYTPPEIAVDLWNALMEAGEPLGLSPVGLGARDTLRLEMGYPLYGHELDDQTNPLEARLGWAVKLAKGPFVGSEALQQVKFEGPRKKLVGLKMIDRGVPRADYPVLFDGEVVGKVTSGTHSPTLKEGVALAYVPSLLATDGRIFEIGMRGGNRKAQVCSYPFVRHTSAG